MAMIWQKWLLTWAAGVALFGLALAGGAFAPTDGILRGLLTLFGTPLPADPDAHHRFAFGLMGAVSLGWGLTYRAAFKALFAMETASAAPFWRMLCNATLIWFAVDSALSVATGFWMNAVSNILLLTLLLIPLLKSGVLRKSA